MATVQEINHDASTVVTNSYTAGVSDPDGGATIIAGAALGGSTYGLNIDFDAGTNFITLTEGFSTTGNNFRMRFKVDFSNVSGSHSDMFVVRLRKSTTQIFRFIIRSGSPLTIQIQYLSDSTGMTAISPDITGVSATSELCCELRVIRETNSSSGDGEVEVFINGISRLSVANLDNFTAFGAGPDDMQLVCNSFDAGTTGDLYFDEWILDDNDTANLGCNVFSGYNLIQGGGKP